MLFISWMVDIDTLAADPVNRLWFGTEYRENPEIWITDLTEDIKRALQVGRIFTVQTPEEKVMAVAVCFGLGFEMSDVPESEELRTMRASLPAEQRLYCDEVSW